MALHLITGGGGYLGSHLARRLIDGGHRVRALDLATACPLPDGVESLQGDVRDAGVVRRACDGVEVVHHLAFVQSMSRQPEAVQRAVAIEGTRNAIDGAAAAGARRVVFTSTIEIYGTRPPCPCPEDAPVDPVGLYGRLKWEAEQLALEHGRARGVEVAALRMPTICGRGFYNHRPLLALIERAATGAALAVSGAGSTRADFVHVDDVVASYALAAEHPRAAGEAFNVSARASATHLEIVRAIAAAAGGRSRVLHVPALVTRVALRLGRAIGVTDLPPEQDGYLFHDNCYSIDKARRLLGYDPRFSAAEAAAALAQGYLADRDAVLARSRSY